MKLQTFLRLLFFNELLTKGLGTDKRADSFGDIHAVNVNNLLVCGKNKNLCYPISDFYVLNNESKCADSLLEISYELLVENKSTREIGFLPQNGNGRRVEQSQVKSSCRMIKRFEFIKQISYFSLLYIFYFIKKMRGSALFIKAY